MKSFLLVESRTVRSRDIIFSVLEARKTNERGNLALINQGL
jgi:hypothetical protein